MTTYELVKYYADLLIIEYINKARAYATIEAQAAPIIMPQTSVQEITFSSVPSSGDLYLSYKGQVTAPLIWNSTAGDIQTALRANADLTSITVTGSHLTSFIVTFTGVIPPALPLEVDPQTSIDATITITETDLILPLAVQGGYNLLGDDVAVGIQLDILGKYVGVTRSGLGFSTNITLNDSDFLQLIRMAISMNSLGSSLYDIQNFIQMFFPGQMYVFDYQNMHMSYLLDSNIGSQDLVQLFVTEGLLPRPMGVQLSVIYAPIIDTFFGFCSYESPTNPLVNPLNDYASYQTDWPWLVYEDGIYPL